MAAGDVYASDPQTVTNGSYLAFQPSAGVEVVVHNVAYAGAMELYMYDGTDEIKVDEDTTAGSRLGLFLHCTNTHYYRIKNVSGGSVLMGADGMTTK